MNWSSALVLFGSASLGGVIAYLLHTAKCLGVTGLQSMVQPGLQFRDRLLVFLSMCLYLVLVVAAIALLAYIVSRSPAMPDRPGAGALIPAAPHERPRAPHPPPSEVPSAAASGSAP